MAFTEEQELSIVKILGTTPTLLDAHLETITLTAAIETAVIAEIDRWETSGAKFTKIHPKERNYGVETFPEQVKTDIKANIARLLEWPFAYAVTSMGTMQIG